MILKNNRAGLTGLGLAFPDGAFKVLTLLPGVNEVADHEWDLAVKQSGVQMYLSEGVLEIVEAPESRQMSAVEVLSALKPLKAEALVKETMSLDVLNEWMKTEKRAKVKEAIKKQIEVLSEPPEYREG